ncbi:MAG TPA: sigma-54 dependent transcriptional regulator [bacterium]|nr:sigma-54 dependent transcriptional regulator [bacterium]HOL96567.1 sigma-54 dependent transcriptional regulator [bacterium]HPP01680.1 sigma-54 dependent transcriptional regulator [bacterium]
MGRLHRGMILVVDDEPGMCHILKRLMSDQGYTVHTANRGEEALKLLAPESYDVILLDIRMPGLDGLQVLDRIKEVSPDTAVIMMTAFGTIETAVQAMKRGAYEYITKPFNNDEVLHIVGNALERKRLLDRTRYLTQVLEERQGMADLIGGSHVMQELYRLIEKVAPTDSTVLILGESGTGKELVARAIHSHSDRKEEKFLAINCGALPRELIESELFGHEKGAFSGAHQRKTGLLESADGGTVFLDEIGDLPLDLQATLLRVLEDKKVRPVGSVTPKPVDFRLIAATNRDLKGDVQAKKFREDLYYRLSIVDIHLPPLRQRNEDIPLLAKHFISRFNQKLNRAVEGISVDALKRLMNYSWPGNVRELENVIQRCMILRESGLIEESDLPQSLMETPAAAVPSPIFDPTQVSFIKAREGFEYEYLQALLRINEGNVTQSALMAGISRRYLQELMKKHGLRALEGEGE